jgi:hypothetical protein
MLESFYSLRKFFCSRKNPDRHSHMFLAGIQTNFRLDPRLKHSGVIPWKNIQGSCRPRGSRGNHLSFSRPWVLFEKLGALYAFAMTRFFLAISFYDQI